jgi:hypothetical protein
MTEYRNKRGRKERKMRGVAEIRDKRNGNGRIWQKNKENPRQKTVTR